VEAVLHKIMQTREARADALRGVYGSVAALKSLTYKMHNPEETRKSVESVRHSRKDAINGVAGSLGARKSLQYLSTKVEN
jgi:hypothetical protein